jgi:hypothetical protein
MTEHDIVTGNAKPSLTSSYISEMVSISGWMNGCVDRAGDILAIFYNTI